MDKREFMREFTSASINLYDNEGRLICKVTAKDISAGGVLVVSHELEFFEDFEPGDEVNFTLKLPTGEIAGTAEVSWTNPDEASMGLKFKKILKGDSRFMDFIANGFF